MPSIHRFIDQKWRVRGASPLSQAASHAPDTTDIQPPRLPSELCRKIISFTTRLAGATIIELDDPFGTPYVNEEYPELDFNVFRDRKNLSLVCSSWYDIVTEISMEYIVVYSDKQLRTIIKKLERSEPSPYNKKLGERTTRIDFKIVSKYKVSNVVRLFRSTPNVMIYTNKNGSGDQPSRHTPVEVFKAIIDNCGKSIRRVEWSGPGEPPRFEDLCGFCNRLPNLTTLRLMSIFSYPAPIGGPPPLIHLSRLKTLSLGIIPEPRVHRQEYALTWDLFLRYLSVHTRQLPSLERFDCDLFPQITTTFFNVHGSKLKMFRTTTCFADVFLPEAVAACPNLVDLVIVHGPELVAFPQYHPSIRRICIYPAIDVDVEVPMKIYEHAVISPLDTVLKAVEEMMASQLVEVRIRNSGTFKDITTQMPWLTCWWRRWNLRRIQFLDKDGDSYQAPQETTDRLLNLVRG